MNACLPVSFILQKVLSMTLMKSLGLILTLRACCKNKHTIKIMCLSHLVICLQFSCNTSDTYRLHLRWSQLSAKCFAAADGSDCFGVVPQLQLENDPLRHQSQGSCLCHVVPKALLECVCCTDLHQKHC